jgi:hypothetical protein
VTAYSAVGQRRKTVTEMNMEYLASQFASARLKWLIHKKPTEYVRMKEAGELDEHVQLIGKQAAEEYVLVLKQIRESLAARGETNEGWCSRSAWELTMESVNF